MTNLQEAFLNELKSKRKFTISEYAQMYAKHTKLAIQEELENGASEHQAKTMGEYYTVAVLSNFISNENILSRIIALKESEK